MSERANDIRWHGELWSSIDGHRFGDRPRMALLAAIAECGSITHAARALGVSYKAAWDAVAAMNAQAGAPLVMRSAGGRKGGGSRLTELGHGLLADFARLAEAQRAFLLRREGRAENRLPVMVTGGTAGEVTLQTAAGQPLVALRGGAPGAQVGQLLLAHVAPDAIVLLAGDAAVRLSARNRLCGQVERLLAGALDIDCGEGLILRADITEHSRRELGLCPGARVTALFKASSLELDGQSIHTAAAGGLSSDTR